MLFAVSFQIMISHIFHNINPIMIMSAVMFSYSLCQLESRDSSREA